jgi:Lecithin:cholesterol acyltransferase
MRSRILVAMCGAALALLASAPSSVATPQRPLVFVPGILGSNLAYDGEIIWGDGDSLLNLSKLHLNPADGRPLELKPAGVVETVPLVFGLIKIDQYSGLIEFLEGIGYERDRNLFLFAYDWRQSNFVTAQNLSRFVQQNLQPGQPYDLLVHSMGGIVARIFLQESQPGAESVHTLIEMAVPHYGSVNVVATLREGWGSLENLMAGGVFNGTQKIRDVLVSFPSIYELFPRYPRCCAFGKAASGSNIEIERPWSTSLWTHELRWVVNVPSCWSNIRQSVEFGLEKASNLQEIMDATETNIPHIQRYFSFEGRRVETRETIYFSQSDETISYRLSENGDGTVHRESGMSAHAKPSYLGLRQHGTMFNDRALRIVLKEIVSSDSFEIEPVDDDRDQIAGRDVRSYEFSVSPAILLEGAAAEIRLRIEAMSGSWENVEFPVEGVITSALEPSFSRLVELSPMATVDELAAGVTSFRGVSPNLSHAGSYRVALIVDGIKRLDDFIAVLPSEPGSLEAAPDGRDGVR